MPNLDDHMDELFKKAADHYPLQTQPLDADAFIKKMRQQETESSSSSLSRSKKAWPILLLLLLLGGSLLTYFVSVIPSGKEPAAKTAIDQKLANKLPEASGKLQTAKGQIHSEQKHQPVDNDVQKKEDGSVQNGAVVESILSFNNEPVITKGISRNNQSLTAFPFRSLPVSNAGTTQEIVQEQTINSGFETQKTNYAQSNLLTESTGLFKTPQKQNRYLLITPNRKSSINLLKPSGEQPILQTSSLLPSINQSIVSNQPHKVANNQDALPKPASKIPSFKPGFYAGLLGGVEVSQVKNQGLSSAGLNGGILLGLQVKKRWALETGVQFGKKVFYSDGEYFKARTGDMPSDMKVMSIKSNCDLIEIPVAVKFDITKGKNLFYGKLGVSSYILTKEKNDYNAMIAGQEQNIQKTYKNGTSFSAAQLSLSAGYTQSISPKINLRLEPYIQVPLKGIGIGAMPVTSSGIHLILIRK